MAKFIPENIQTLLSTFKFDIDTDCINEDLTCAICKKLLYDTFQSTCDCKYCRKCIVSYINDGNEYCPGGKDECREDLLVLDETVLSNAFLNKKVLKVRVRCLNESCQFTSTLTQMEDHLRVCSLQPMECPYKKIGCANERVHRDSVETHLNKYMLAHSQMLMEVVDNLKNEVGGLKEQMASLREECNLKDREIREEERRMYQEERGALAVEIEELKREVAALKMQVKCSEEIERKKSRKMTDEFEALKKEMDAKSEELRKMRGEIEVLQGDVKRIDCDTGKKEKTEADPINPDSCHDEDDSESDEKPIPPLGRRQAPTVEEPVKLEYQKPWQPKKYVPPSVREAYGATFVVSHSPRKAPNIAKKSMFASLRAAVNVKTEDDMWSRVPKRVRKRSEAAPTPAADISPNPERYIAPALRKVQTTHTDGNKFKSLREESSN